MVFHFFSIYVLLKILLLKYVPYAKTKQPKKTKQKISISYEINQDNSAAAKKDTIEAATDYKSITKAIISFVEENKFELVETFAEKIAEMVIKKYKVKWIKLRVSKPGALRFSKDVGVIIERTSKSYE